MAYTGPYADVHLHSHNDHKQTVRMLDTLADMGIVNGNLLAITYVDTPFENNLTTLFDKATYTRFPLHAFGSPYYHPHLNYFGLSFRKQVELLLDMGFDGIKLIEMKPNFRRYIGFGWDSKQYDEMFDLLEERQTPIIAHINDPELFWDLAEYQKRYTSMNWFFGDDSCLTFNQILLEVLARLVKNPRLNIVFAHFMYISKRPKLAEELMARYPNLKLDLTPGWDMFVHFAECPEFWQAFFTKYRDRIFYGTDSCSANDSDYLHNLHKTVRVTLSADFHRFPIPHYPRETMCGLDLSEETQARICYTNYQHFLPICKPIRKDLFEAHTHDLCRILSLDGGNEARIAMLRKNCAELCK